MTDIQSIKQRFGIIGNSPMILRDIETAVQVALTDLSVLITGESGVGKEHFPQIIHAYSSRKHGPYFAVNCGAIPEGTIDSELFGHEKGAFTDAKAERKGYFEIADGGTLFLDEVGELPLSTQVRLLRVLETGEFIKMGSSQIQKTNVRVVAATNLNIPEAISKGKFREDLYYRLNTVEIKVPALRERKEDIPLLFRKFAQDFAEKYKMPPVKLADAAVRLLQSYNWYGNIRQLKNVTEQMSVLETEHENVSEEVLRKYLPQNELQSGLTLFNDKNSSEDIFQEKKWLYLLLEMRQEVALMRQQINGLLQHQSAPIAAPTPLHKTIEIHQNDVVAPNEEYALAEEMKEEHFQTMEEVQREVLEKALKKNKGNRKATAEELHMSERTLYRRIKEYGL